MDVENSAAVVEVEVEVELSHVLEAELMTFVPSVNLQKQIKQVNDFWIDSIISSLKQFQK